MKYICFLLCLLSFSFILTGCDDPSNTSSPTPSPTSSPDETSPPENSPTPIPTTPPSYSASISVVNNDTELYRLYMGTSDDLYNADTDQTNLDEGELFIESIPAGTTVNEPLDLETNTSLTKDWVLEFYFEAFEMWSVVVCTEDSDADGYLFEANETYTITIESTADISIERITVK